MNETIFNYQMHRQHMNNFYNNNKVGKAEPHRNLSQPFEKIPHSSKQVVNNEETTISLKQQKSFVHTETNFGTSGLIAVD